jgi:hypothetical protein
MLIPFGARRKSAGIAQHVAPLFNEVIETVKQVMRRRESGVGHDAPPGFRRERYDSQSPIAAGRRCGDAGSTPQTTSCSVNYGIAQWVPPCRGFFFTRRLLHRKPHRAAAVFHGRPGSAYAGSISRDQDDCADKDRRDQRKHAIECFRPLRSSGDVGRRHNSNSPNRFREPATLNCLRTSRSCARAAKARRRDRRPFAGRISLHRCRHRRSDRRLS